jgi:hypothetical protein
VTVLVHEARQYNVTAVGVSVKCANPANFSKAPGITLPSVVPFVITYSTLSLSFDPFAELVRKEYSIYMNRISIDTSICHGKPVIQWTRILVPTFWLTSRFYQEA